MESQHGSNLKNIRKKRATAQQSIVSLSCLVCIAFAAIWGFHAGSGNSRAVEAKKMSASSSVAENESSESKADSSTADKPKSEQKNPQTGSGSGMSLWLAMLLISGGAAMGIKKKHKK